jgi:4-oxalocrotonate tautomerase
MSRLHRWLVIGENDQMSRLEETPMPYVNVRITRDGATAEQKAELIKGVTDLLVRVLDKDPARTVVVIDEVDTDNWGFGGISVSEFRRKST